MLQKEEIYLLIILGSLVFILVALFLVLFVLYFMKRKRQIELEKEVIAKQFDQTLLQAKVEIQEQTLQYAGRELHDNFGQIASLIKLNLSTLEYLSQEPLLTKIEETKNLTQQLITDIRGLSLSFGNNQLAQTGFSEALRIEVQRLNGIGSFEANFSAGKNIPFISSDIAIILFRMVQEALNNIVKHSAARHINVSLEASAQLLSLSIEDDGIGFDVAMARQKGGQGMQNLATRAALIGAKISIESTMQKGTQIIIYLPL